MQLAFKAEYREVRELLYNWTPPPSSLVPKCHLLQNKTKSAVGDHEQDDPKGKVQRQE